MRARAGLTLNDEPHVEVVRGAGTQDKLDGATSGGCPFEADGLSGSDSEAGIKSEGVGTSAGAVLRKGDERCGQNGEKSEELHFERRT